MLEQQNCKSDIENPIVLEELRQRYLEKLREEKLTERERLYESSTSSFSVESVNS